MDLSHVTQLVSGHSHLIDPCVLFSVGSWNGMQGRPRPSLSCLASCLSPDLGVEVWGKLDYPGSSQHSEL